MVKIMGNDAVGKHIIKKIQEKKNVLTNLEDEKVSKLQNKVQKKKM
jgi:hypothetical protein